MGGAAGQIDTVVSTAGESTSTAAAAINAHMVSDTEIVALSTMRGVGHQINATPRAVPQLGGTLGHTLASTAGLISVTDGGAVSARRHARLQIETGAITISLPAATEGMTLPGDTLLQ